MTRRGAWVSLAVLGVCAAAVHAQQRRPSTSSRDADLPVLLSIEDDRASTRADLDVLLGALRGPLGELAIRALGRLERRDVITDLLPFVALNGTRGTTATALALAIRGPALEGVPHGQQERAVLDALIAAGDSQLQAAFPIGLHQISRSLGRLPYQDVESFRSAETFLRRVLEKPFLKDDDLPHADAARGLESLARLNRKIATLEEETLSRLRTVARTLDPKRADAQRNALAALIAAQGVDADTLEIVLKDDDPEVRRLAVLALSGSGSSIDDEERVGYIRKSLSDTSFMVRLEAVRAWTRRGVKEHGCQPLLEALNDQSMHVVLVALDALGDVCRDDAAITDAHGVGGADAAAATDDGSARCMRSWHWPNAIASAPRSACWCSRCTRRGRCGCTPPGPRRSSTTSRC